MDSPGGHDLARLVGDLKNLGLPSGRNVLVHCSMSRLGPVHNGPSTVHEALACVIGLGNSVVVPTHTANNSTTSNAFRAATHGMNPAEVAEYVARMEGFDPSSTRSFQMGQLAEYLRVQPGALRSRHPQTSFVAVGPNAAELVGVHRLRSHLGPDSPIGALYRSDASIALIGVGYEACTALHLAEYRLKRPPHQRYRCFVRTARGRRRRQFRAIYLDDSDFIQLGADLDRELFVRFGMVGDAPSRVMPVRAAVDFAGAWMSRHRRR